jgi:hypothetical protein
MNLFNGRNEYIGTIVSTSGTDSAYDAQGRQVGYSNDEGTFDSNGSRVGSSGLISTLINK